MEWQNVPGHQNEVNLDLRYGAVAKTMPVKLLSDDAKTPTYGTSQAAGLDLYSSETVVIQPYRDAIVQTDVAVKIPEGCYGRVAE